MLQLFVNGPPGAGKTSLCKLLCEEFGLELVATGDLLRENILQKTPLGLIAKDCISRKSLVPDHVVVDMVAEKICECFHRKGWVLDGFPRTAEQSTALRRKQIYPSVVIVLELSERECVKRITGRRFDPVTSKIYHMPTIMPRESGVLARLTKRSDDVADKLPPRFEAYRQHGESTNALYDGVLHRVEVSHKQPQEILDAVMELLHANRPHSASDTSASAASSASPAARSNQAAAAPPPVIPIKQSMATIGAVPMNKRQLHQVPQRIEEEDDDQVEQEAQGEQRSEGGMFKFAPEHRQTPAQPPGGKAGSQPAGSVSTTASHGPATYSPYDDDLSRLDVDFQAMHVEVGKEMEAIASPSSSPSSSPSQSPSSATSKARAPEAAKSMFTSNNEESRSPAASPPLSPVAQPGSNASLTPPRSASSANGVDLNKFKDVLLDGFDVLKHGRRGSPHARTIFTDMEFKRIFWMKPGKEAKAKKAKLDQSLLLADVVQVLRGMKTEVLKRSGDVGKYERYLSLVADDRTLDLELPSEAMCDFLLRGFEQLLHGSS